MLSFLKHQRDLAKEYSQKQGPMAYWDIKAFNTYEEAYAHVLGYEPHEMEDVIAIANAMEAHRNGTYQAPTQYFIHPDIPAKRFLPVHPSKVHPWYGSPKHDSVLPSPTKKGKLSSKANYRTQEASESVLFSPKKKGNLGSVPSPAFHQAIPSTPSPQAYYHISAHIPASLSYFPGNQNSSTPSGSNKSGSNKELGSRRPPRPVSPNKAPEPEINLTLPMRRYLQILFRCTNAHINEITRILSDSSLSSECYPVLQKVGLSPEQTEFFLDWVYDTFNPTDDELKDDEESD